MKVWPFLLLPLSLNKPPLFKQYHMKGSAVGLNIITAVILRPSAKDYQSQQYDLAFMWHCFYTTGVWLPFISNSNYWLALWFLYYIYSFTWLHQNKQFCHWTGLLPSNTNILLNTHISLLATLCRYICYYSRAPQLHCPDGWIKLPRGCIQTS